MKTGIRIICLVGLLCALTGSVRAAPVSPTVPSRAGAGAVPSWMADHLEVGLRVSGARLRHPMEYEVDSEGMVTSTFLGSIYKLDPNSDLTPDLYINYMFTDWIGLQLGWDSIEVDAIRLTDQGNDGTFSLDGPSLLLQGRWVTDVPITPYAGAGVVFLDVGFTPEPAWHNGFGGDDYQQDYQDWVDRGSPEWPNAGYQRNLDVTEDRQVAPLLQAGCRASITDRIHVDVEARYLMVDVDLHFYLSRYGDPFQDAGNTTFPLDMWLFSVGVAGSF